MVQLHLGLERAWRQMVAAFGACQAMRHFSLVGLVLLVATVSSVRAQFDPSDLDPFNRNSGIRQSWNDLDPFRPALQIQTEVPGARGLWFHNKTNKTISVAIVYFVRGSDSISAGDYNLPVSTPDAWIVSGWYDVAPGKEIAARTGDLTNRYYYFYAEDGKRHWGGDHTYYVDARNAFSYDSRDRDQVKRVKGQGFVARGFQKIDTANATGFTMHLK